MPELEAPLEEQFLTEITLLSLRCSTFGSMASGIGSNQKLSEFVASHLGFCTRLTQ